jgi:hypothetical protein
MLFISTNFLSRKDRICQRNRDFAQRNQGRRPIDNVLEVKLESSKATLVDAFDQAVNNLSSDPMVRRQLAAVIRFQIHSD